MVGSNVLFFILPSDASLIVKQIVRILSSYSWSSENMPGTVLGVGTEKGIR
jgi:hypothetical protein